MKRTKSVLIVGGSGFIGTHLSLRLREKYKVCSTYFRRPIKMSGVSYFRLDAINRDWVKRIVYVVSPDIVIFVAGSNDAPYAEENPRETDKIHSNGAVTIATTAGILQPRFIFLSNNYVFDGRKGNYKENDIVLPVNNLGKAKLSSEKYFMGSSNYVVVRSSPVYGRSNGRNLSYLDELRLKLERKETVQIPDNETHSFAPINGLVDVIEMLVDGGPRNTILHYGGITKVSEFQFARKFARYLGYDESLVHKKETYEPDLDYSLNSTKTVDALKIRPLLLEEGFDLFKKELISRTSPI